MNTRCKSRCSSSLGVANSGPVVLLLPGMANSSRSIYIRYSALAFGLQGASKTYLEAVEARNSPQRPQVAWKTGKQVRHLGH